MKKLLLTIITTLSLLSHELELNYTTDVNGLFFGHVGHGVELKGNYTLTPSQYITLLTSYYSLMRNYTGISSLIQPSSINANSTHANIAYGYRLGQTFYWLNEIYIGWMMWHLDGSLTNSTYSTAYSEDFNRHFFDYGWRTGWGWSVTSQLALQLIISKSLRTIHEPISPLLHLIGSEDAPTRILLGMKYKF